MISNIVDSLSRLYSGKNSYIKKLLDNLEMESKRMKKMNLQMIRIEE